MTAHTGDNAFGVTRFRTPSRVSVVDTYWGYILRTKDASADRAALIERICGVAGVHWAFTGYRGSRLSSVSFSISGGNGQTDLRLQ